MPMTNKRKDYPKMGVNFERNNMIFAMWKQYPTRKLQEIADIFGVSYGTVNKVIHKKLEYDNPIYNALARTNERLQYTQSVVTRSYVAIRRWYPDVVSEEDLMKVTIGDEMDNNRRFTQACDRLIFETMEDLRKQHGLF